MRRGTVGFHGGRGRPARSMVTRRNRGDKEIREDERQYDGENGNEYVVVVPDGHVLDGKRVDGHCGENPACVESPVRGHAYGKADVQVGAFERPSSGKKGGRLSLYRFR